LFGRPLDRQRAMMELGVVPAATMPPLGTSTVWVYRKLTPVTGLDDTMVLNVESRLPAAPKAKTIVEIRQIGWERCSLSGFSLGSAPEFVIFSRSVASGARRSVVRM
jgi:hypothetical protein